MNRTVIVGLGDGGRALLRILMEDPRVDILGIATKTKGSIGRVIAQEHGIFATTDIQKLLSLPDIDVIIDASGSKTAAEQIARFRPEGAELIGGLTLDFMWNMVDERVRREQDQRALYDIGVLLTTADSEEEVLRAILNSACELLGAPAASIALYDKPNSQLLLRCSRGFSRAFSSNQCWPVRKGGLSYRILRSKSAVVFEDVQAEPELFNEILRREGVRSVAAVPLVTRGRILGILYVDDFKVRGYDQREIGLLTVLGAQAALAMEKARFLEDKERMAITDGLTGVANYRHFRGVLQSEISRARRYGHELCLAMMDIDFFKLINDRLGHTRGDEALRQVAQVINSELRVSDFVARYGGEEFALILPHTSMGEAVHAAEKIRRSIETLRIEGDHGDSLPVTISIGLADFPVAGADVDDLVKAADSALLLAKRRGRNRVCVFQDVAGLLDTEEQSPLSGLTGRDFLSVGALIAAVQSATTAPSSHAASAAMTLADALGLSREERETLLLGALIHGRTNRHSIFRSSAEVGDAASRAEEDDPLPEFPPLGLTDSEWSTMREHSGSVMRVVRALSGLGCLAPALLHHHKRWDGQGAGDGHKGESIPILARALAVCEVYQDLLTPGADGRAFPVSEVEMRLREMAGRELDPALVELMLPAAGSGDTPASSGSTRGTGRYQSYEGNDGDEGVADEVFVVDETAGSDPVDKARPPL